MNFSNFMVAQHINVCVNFLVVRKYNFQVQSNISELSGSIIFKVNFVKWASTGCIISHV